MRSCSACDHRTWLADGSPVQLDGVLAELHDTRRTRCRSRAAAGVVDRVPARRSALGARVRSGPLGPHAGATAVAGCLPPCGRRCQHVRRHGWARRRRPRPPPSTATTLAARRGVPVPRAGPSRHRRRRPRSLRPTAFDRASRARRRGSPVTRVDEPRRRRRLRGARARRGAVAAGPHATPSRRAATWAPTCGAPRTCVTTCCRTGGWSGWTPDWYAGFPAFQFYMVVPSLAIVVLGGFAPFAVFTRRARPRRSARSPCAPRDARAAPALRRSRRSRRSRARALHGDRACPTASRSRSSPSAASSRCRSARGRSASSAGSRSPARRCSRSPTLPFLFDRSFNIYGGNIASTMAGEFAFSMSLSLSVLAIGLAIRAMDTGRGRGWAAIVFALRRPVPHLPRGVGGRGRHPLLRSSALVIGCCPRCPNRRSRAAPCVTQLVSLATVMPVAGLLGAFWALPFHRKSTYLNDMGWEKLTWFKSYLLTRNQLNPSDILRDSPPLEVVFGIAAVGLLLCIARRNRLGIALAHRLRGDRAAVRPHAARRAFGTRACCPSTTCRSTCSADSALYEAVRLIVEKVWARWYVVYALSGLVLVELARATPSRARRGRAGSAASSRVSTRRPSGALLIGGLATLRRRVAAADGSCSRPCSHVGVDAGDARPRSWSTGGALEQAIAVDAPRRAVRRGVRPRRPDHRRGAGSRRRHRHARGRETGAVFRWSAAPLAFVAIWLVFGPALHSLPGGRLRNGKYRWGIPGFELTTADSSYLDGWAEYNFRGLEREGRRVSRVPRPRRHDRARRRGARLRALDVGVRRPARRLRHADGADVDPALHRRLHRLDGGALLRGVVDHAVPLHHAVGALREPVVRGSATLAYPGFDMDLGIEELQLLGVRYYLAFTPKGGQRRAREPRLHEIDAAGVWHMFMIADTDLVVPLRYSPVVYDNVGEEQDEWVHPGVAFVQGPRGVRGAARGVRSRQLAALLGARGPQAQRARARRRARRGAGGRRGLRRADPAGRRHASSCPR